MLSISVSGAFGIFGHYLRESLGPQASCTVPEAPTIPVATYVHSTSRHTCNGTGYTSNLPFSNPRRRHGGTPLVAFVVGHAASWVNMRDKCLLIRVTAVLLLHILAAALLRLDRRPFQCSLHLSGTTTLLPPGGPGSLLSQTSKGPTGKGVTVVGLAFGASGSL